MTLRVDSCREGLVKRLDSKQIDLQSILKGVSRSFYLSLVFLPRKIRPALGLGYLFCRAADTIADTNVLPESERLAVLKIYQDQFRKGPNPDQLFQISQQIVGGGALAAEELLIKNLNACFNLYASLPPTDRQLLRDLVLELSLGMEMDLKRAGDTEPLDDAKLDLYIFYVAGVVGEFWTKVLRAHYRFMQKRDLSRLVDCGIHFGKGLQLVNLIRDESVDLRNGRVYLSASRRNDYLKLAEEHLSHGWAYVDALPIYACRLRSLCLLPLLLGYQTLSLMKKKTGPIKTTRFTVYKDLVLSFLFFWHPEGLKRLA